MTAQLLTNPVDLLLLETEDMIPEGEIKHIDVTLNDDGSAFIDIRILVNADIDHIVLEVDKNCLRRVDGKFY